MDPFTQRMLDKAEQRSKALGVTPVSKKLLPLTERNQEKLNSQTSSSKPTISPRRQQQTSNTYSREETVTKSGSTTTKIIKNVSDRNNDGNESKENVDVAVEINITTGPNIQVQVEVEEQDVDSDGNIVEKVEQSRTPAIIRDTSRNRLQRLGALYSENPNLSSPIHRTEAQFHADSDTDSAPPQSTRPKKKFGKLAALADEINNWEDDTSHPDYKRKEVHPSGPPKPKRMSSPKKPLSQQPAIRSTATGTTPKKYQAPRPPSQEEKDIPKSILSSQGGNASAPATDKVNAKKLQWDRKVMDALESQGYQRRESTTSKLVYDYKKDEDKAKKESERRKNEEQDIEEDEEDEEEEPQLREINDQRERVHRPPSIVPGSEIQKKETGTIHKKVEKPSAQVRSVSSRAAMFENQSTSKAGGSSSSSGRSNQKDPADLSLKERMALFEKNKGGALIPKAPLAISASAKQIMGDSKTTQKMETQQSKIQSFNKPVVAESKASGFGIRNTVAALMSNGTTISESQISQDVKKQRQQEMDLLMNRFTKGATKPTAPPLTPPPAPPMPPTNYKQNSHVDANCVIKTQKRRSGDDKKDAANDCPEVRSVLDDVKRIRVNPPKDGELYPRLSDLETTESDQDYTTASASEEHNERQHLVQMHKTTTQQRRLSYHDQDKEDENDDENSYMDSEDADSSGANCAMNGSLGRAVMNAVRCNEPRLSFERRNKGPLLDSSMTGSEESDALGDIDQYLDDDDDDAEEVEEIKTTPKKGSISSNSFSYEKPVKHVRYETIEEDEEVELRQKSKFRTPVKSELTVNPSKDNDMVTLVHTVSFYRKQQTESINANTPVRKIQRPKSCVDYTTTTETENSDDDDDDDDSNKSQTDDDNAYLVQEKVKKLFDEVSKQQTIISQTSQALNLCAATVEFSGSTEAVEGERHLLVATHRRQAALNEIQRLRVEGSLRPSGAPKERGRLSVKEILVPLKKDYINKLAADTISGHHLVCLLKYNENVIATRTIPTLPGLVSVKFPDVLTLNNVYADFKVTLEIYGMTAQKEILPHDIKYHIGLNKKNAKLLTPKGKKNTENRLFMPPVQSPAGPNAVRSPALSHYGFVIFSLREIQRTSWSLNQSSGVSPLEGTVHMKVNCELSVSVDYRGFLTMFEDVSGFGAWHRRWCRLNGHVLSYWKYPDDEKKKLPIGSIDLYNCCSQKISVAPRDVCARLNTMLLEIKRPSQDDDIQSLVLVKHGKYTVVRHLLSADTKEEREDWCANLNKSLALLRAWGHPE